MAKITTLVCTYRRPRLLARTLASLQAQTFRDFAVCVFDNASGDETPAVVEWFREKGLSIQYHCHPENLGAEGNFRHALSQDYLTDYIHLLNDDDYVLPRFFEAALQGFVADPLAVFSTTRNAQVTPDGKVCKVTLANWRDGRFGPGEGAPYILARGHPELTAVLYRSDWMRKIGGFDVKTFGLGSDVAFLVLAAAQHSIYASPEMGAVYSVHGGQQSENVEGIDTYAKLFERLQPSAFLSRKHFVKSLRAAARSHIGLLRVFWNPNSGIQREWTASRAFADLCRRRPRFAWQAVGGCFDLYAAAIANKFTGPEPAHDPRIHRQAAIEVERCATMLEKEYVAPCLAALGLKSESSH